MYVAGRAGREPGSDQGGMLRGSGVLAQVLFCAHVCYEGKRSLKVDVVKCSVMLVRRWDVRAICWCTRAETHMKQLIEPCAWSSCNQRAKLSMRVVLCVLPSLQGSKINLRRDREEAEAAAAAAAAAQLPQSSSLGAAAGNAETRELQQLGGSEASRSVGSGGTGSRGGLAVEGGLVGGSRGFSDSATRLGGLDQAASSTARKGWWPWPRTS